MKVLKVINNNVVSCLDEGGKELVVMGKGLGFGAKAGAVLDSELIEKVFRMDSAEEFTRLKSLFAQLPTDLLELCSRIINYANQVLGRRLNESIYLTMTDHIQFAIVRCRQGMNLRNALATEVRVFYPEEYAIGKYALELIHTEMDVELPADEAASIALHLVNAEYDRSMSATMHTAQVLQPIVQILETWPALQLDKTGLYYDELIVHLKFLAMQAFTTEEKKQDAYLPIDILQQNIPSAYACAQAITTYLTEQSGNSISTAELCYLAMSIHRACVS